MSDSSTRTGDEPVFDLSRRGYDRRQVEEHLRTLAARLERTQRAWHAERTRAERAEQQLRESETQRREDAPEVDDGVPSARGFGYRVEKLLRAAEQEAAELRASASREVQALLEGVRADAEAHRHEAERSLISRTAAIQQQEAARTVELDERERQLVEQTVTARDEAERIVADARAQAERLRHDAQARAEQDRSRAEQDIWEQRQAGERELGRLSGLHEEVRGQLARLLDSLAGEVTTAPEPPPEQPPRPPSAPTLLGPPPFPRAETEGADRWRLAEQTLPIQLPREFISDAS
jgi:hypothetical protein